MEPVDRILVTHAAPEAFAPTTCEMLEKLGYRVMESDDYEAGGATGEVPAAVLPRERGRGELSYSLCVEVPIPKGTELREARDLIEASSST